MVIELLESKNTKVKTFKWENYFALTHVVQKYNTKGETQAFINIFDIIT